MYYNKIPIYPIFYLLKGDYRSNKGFWSFLGFGGLGFRGLEFRGLGLRGLGLQGFQAWAWALT